MDPFKKWFLDNRDELQKDFCSYLKFESVSSEPKHKSEVDACASWVFEYLKGCGLTPARWKMPGHDAIFAEKIVGDDLPTVLFYGHYDVQPVDPIELWDSSPFEPTVDAKGKIVCRGASDNKGHSFYFMIGIRYFLQKYQDAKVNIKVIIEGEEEVGSESLMQVGKDFAKELAADQVLIVDMGIGSFEKPLLSTGSKGILHMDIECQTATRDHHSGDMGGIMLNPLMVLSQLFSQVFDGDGKIAIDGFYDGIEPLSETGKEKYCFDFDEKHYRDDCGVMAFHHEKGYSQRESNWIRPTFEINGMWGGYIGDGFKTVLPAKAFAKVSCRLVPGQNAGQLVKNIEEFFQKRLPEGVKLSFSEIGGTDALWAGSDSEAAVAMAQAIEDVLGKKVGYSLAGGSIPIAPRLKELSGGEVIYPGMGLTEDKIHAPNEEFDMQRIELGAETIVRYLEIISKVS